MNKKGEAGLLAILVAIVGTVASTGVLFGGGNAVSSGFFSGVTVLTVYSQMPHVKRDFRERKAIKEFGFSEAQAQALSDVDLLSAIKDDAPGVPNRVLLMKQNPKWRVGG